MSAIANAELQSFTQDTDSIVVTVTNKSDGSAYNITGSTFYFTAKADKEDTTAAITKTVTSHTNPTGGITTINLTTSDLTVAPGNYHIWIVMQEASGDVTTLVYGRYNIRQGRIYPNA